MTRFKVLEDVVFIPLKTNVHLILEIKQRLCIVIRSQFYFISNLSSNIQLDPLVEIEGGDTPLPFRDSRVFGTGSIQAKSQFR